MDKVKFSCQIITPMFMFGASPLEPELRPASIKGMMRFWWRAMRTEDNMEALREREENIFGGIGGKAGKSKVRIIVNADTCGSANLSSSWDLIKYGWVQSKNGRPYKKPLKGFEGVHYLFYPMFLSTQERPCFAPGATFEITILSQCKDALKNALAAFWLSVNLGGFGSRSRRGAGNVAVKSVDNNDLIKSCGLDFIPGSLGAENLAAWIMANVCTASSIINNGKEVAFTSKYSNLSFSRLLVSRRSESNWHGAIDDLGRKYKTFRGKNKHHVFETAAFGLPVMHRSNKTRVQGRQGKEIVTRRSSPLIFKIWKTGENIYHWGALRLSGEFLSEGGVISEGFRTQKPEYTLLEEFWHLLKGFAQENVLLTPASLDKMKGVIAKDLNPEKIIVFGSRAKGNYHSKSDLDLAVDAPVSTENCRLIAPVDLVNIRKAGEPLRNKIRKEGVSVYEKKDG